MENKISELNLRIDWSEMDQFGHVNNVSYFKYIQAARVGLWERLGIMERMKAENIGPMLASASCRFTSPLFYPGEVRIKTLITFIKNSSFGITHLLYGEEDVLCAAADDVAVMYDFNTDKKMEIGDTLRARMQDYLLPQEES